MKKIYVIILLLVLGYVYIPKIYTMQKFKKDHAYVKNVMLQKDSENRGFSDIVKQKIEKNFSDPEVQRVLSLHAKAFREVVKSETESEFIDSSKILMIRLGCSAYLLFKNKQQDRLEPLTEQYLSDSHEMFSYYEYLGWIRFPNSYNKIIDFSNSGAPKIHNDEEFNKLCKK